MNKKRLQFSVINDIVKDKGQYLKLYKDFIVGL